MIAVVDYGMGNLRSVQKAFEKLGFDARITSSPDEIEQAAGVVVPGVGAFADTMESLTSAGVQEAVLAQIGRGRPFLGICLGLQVLMGESEEGGLHRGLGVFEGRVRRLPDQVKVPHMGWNQVEVVRPTPVFDGIESGSYFYFVHSYYVDPADPEAVAGRTDYGVRFASVLSHDNLVAVQFHPEKSGMRGLRLLSNFGGMCSDHPSSC